jgi:hypothetical protein
MRPEVPPQSDDANPEMAVLIAHRFSLFQLKTMHSGKGSSNSSMADTRCTLDQHHLEPTCGGTQENGTLTFHPWRHVLADTSSFLNPCLCDFFKTARFYTLHPTVYTEVCQGCLCGRPEGWCPELQLLEVSSRPGSAEGTDSQRAGSSSSLKPKAGQTTLQEACV